MTAIITKPNAKDKAFINSDGTGGDYPKDAVFDFIKDQSIDCDTIKVNKEATFTVNDEQITFTNHELKNLNNLAAVIHHLHFHLDILK